MLMREISKLGPHVVFPGPQHAFNDDALAPEEGNEVIEKTIRLVSSLRMQNSPERSAGPSR